MVTERLEESLNKIKLPPSVLIDHKIGVGSIVHNVVFTSQYYLRHFFSHDSLLWKHGLRDFRSRKTTVCCVENDSP